MDRLADPSLQGSFVFFPELSGPGANLADIHGLLMFSVPGCIQYFTSKMHPPLHQRARLSNESNRAG